MDNDKRERARARQQQQQQKTTVSLNKLPEKRQPEMENQESEQTISGQS